MGNIFSLTNILRTSTTAFLFLLPWQTIFLVREVLINGGKWQYGTLGWYGTELLLWITVLLFLIWYARRVAAERKTKKETWSLTADRGFVLACLLVVSYCAASTVWAFDQAIALQQSLRILEALLIFFVIFLGPLQTRVAIGVFILGAAVQSGLGILQFAFQQTWSSTLLGLSEFAATEGGVSVVAGSDIGRWLRAYGAFPHPNVFGGYMVVSLLATSLYWYFFQKQHKQWAPFLLVIATLQITALFLTFSRAAWIASAMYAAGFFVFVMSDADKREKKSVIRYAAVLASVVLVLTGLFFPLVKNRTTHASALEIRSTTERVSGYREAIGLFRENPMVGVGVGNYTAAIISKDATRPGWEYQPVHMVPLLALVELGVLGMMIVGGVIIGFWRAFVRGIEKRRVLVLFMAFVPIVVLSIFDHFLYSSYVGLALFGVYGSLLLRTCLRPHSE